MKKFVTTISTKFQHSCQRMTHFLSTAQQRAHTFLTDCTGDLATSTIGSIIITVVIIGLLVFAINAFFPGFFTSMFNAMQTKLDANW